MSEICMKNIMKKIKKHNILLNANINVKEGEICALIGPNGVGKTTLLKILLHLIKQDSGSISINNKIVNNKNINTYLKDIGSVLTFPESINDLTIKELFNQHFHYMGVDNQSIVSILNKVKLNVSLDAKAGQFSLGMKQRLLLGLAISHNPSIIILDEPFNGLDIDGVEIFQNIIKEQKTKGKSIIITSHSMNDLNSLVDSVIALKNGKTFEKKDIRYIKNKYNGKIESYYKKVINNE